MFLDVHVSPFLDLIILTSWTLDPMSAYFLGTLLITKTIGVSLLVVSCISLKMSSLMHLDSLIMIFSPNLPCRNLLLGKHPCPLLTSTLTISPSFPSLHNRDTLPTNDNLSSPISHSSSSYVPEPSHVPVQSESISSQISSSQLVSSPSGSPTS